MYELQLITFEKNVKFKASIKHLPEQKICCLIVERLKKTEYF